MIHSEKDLICLGSISKTLVCEVLGGVVNPDAPVYTQSQPIHRVQCILTGEAATITEMPPEKFNMGIVSTTFKAENERHYDLAHCISRSKTIDFQ